ncbi:MAG: anhydro-N-acetylmuramic acid kinase [Pseudomonadota bacterium]
MLFAGLISGTSRDAIDAVVVRLRDDRIELLATHSQPYDAELQSKLDGLIANPSSFGLAGLGELHAWIGESFADAALAAIAKAGVNAHDVVAIGSHGQTIHHGPGARHPYSLQIGDAARIATRTGIATVADFRSADIAAGGQGAPLVPPFHQWLFGKPGETTAVVNIGGIANATLISDEQLLGFDTGPGNTLLDAWIRKHRNESFDRDGNWSRQGQVRASCLDAMLADAYFKQTPPKSTGFEYFNLDWLASFTVDAPEDMQATLLALSVESIARSIRPFKPASVLVCGGGVHNSAMMERLQNELSDAAVASTASRGLDPDWVEACAFAWLAQRRMAGLPGNAPTVTGARSAVPLGAIYQP